MIDTELSPNTKAILLLTAPLIVGHSERTLRANESRLTFGEYLRLEGQLRQLHLEPADLVGPEAGEVLRECRSFVDVAQLGGLLERGFQLSQVLEHWAARSIWVIGHLDSDYPGRLKGRLGARAPLVIFGCGDRSLLEDGGLAVVGSRNVSEDLIHYAERIGRIGASARWSIVSGGARGVDQAAMRGALTEGGTAVGVLADRLENAVMHREHRDVLMDGRLTLISPYDPRAGFSVGNAMRRNKLVYALADASLVVSTAYRKGGTWTGAVEQLEKLRLIPVYVRADDQGDRGLIALLNKGARVWPEPKTPEEFMATVVSGEQSQSRTESLWKKTFQFDVEATEDTTSALADAEITREICEPNESTDVGGTPPADALFAKIEELLSSIDTPTTETAVASYLQVSRSQARDWLKRLVAEGKFRRTNRPVRYYRTAV